eukprot:CAMPEP_0185573210 /NCGR_PEP_ID=MMETSP0434-20130131/4984_1 /TAXON_ID=626734 ORGANISM="Favella taraikaensis, Strain Fe Narragansett Bay" /NCGR_SAMPLE_ID=MMETSP0434 /ASSEMBLY_ACC=CAM_ASM_000379 /LENGTH=94 /DNA_ID=CAMNT_0028189373 /DNA_START=856 /DNA_END=1141 /DNA_ORIENTATION=+
MCAEEHRVGSHDLSLTTSDEYSKSFEAKRGVKGMRLGEKINLKTETTHKSAYVDGLDEAEVTTPTEFSTAGKLGFIMVEVTNAPGLGQSKQRSV